MKKITTFFIIGLSVIAISWFYNFYTGALAYSLNPLSSKRVTVKIEKGSSANDVADQLFEKKMIKSLFAFNIYLKQHNLADKIKAGNIVLQENYNMKKIAEILVDGKGSEITITIPEGFTVKQIAEKLEKEGLAKASEFLDCVKTCKFDYDFLPKGYLEGYLYPDTYFVNISTYSDKQLISRMINTLKTRISDDDWKAIKSGKHSFEQIMIMASIIEREESDSKERSTVAGILWDRLDNKVALGADATVLYALGRTKGGLNYNDLNTNNPFNTRKFRGLPPTPISNPDITSIRAAIYPKKTDYFYYLHDSQGKVHYAKTLNEHNENKKNYLN